MAKFPFDSQIITWEPISTILYAEGDEDQPGPFLVGLKVGDQWRYWSAIPEGPDSWADLNGDVCDTPSHWTVIHPPTE